MAYTETSDYGYITGDQLEAYSGIDYSVVNSTKYSEANVMAKVSIAERMINGYCFPSGGSFSTTTDAVFSATILLSERIMHNTLVKDNYNDGDIVVVWDATIEKILSASEYSPIDLIPTQGIDR